mgnify:CR=1 FL=1
MVHKGECNVSLYLIRDDFIDSELIFSLLDRFDQLQQQFSIFWVSSAGLQVEDDTGRIGPQK